MLRYFPQLFCMFCIAIANISAIAEGTSFASESKTRLPQKEDTHSEITNQTDESPEILKAAIFVQNNALPFLNDKLDQLNDLLSTRLTNVGFSVIDARDVINNVRETKRESETNDIGTQNIKTHDVNTRIAHNIGSTISGNSALRLTQMTGADYLVVATINSIGSEKRSFRGEGTIYKTNNDIVVITMRIALKLLESKQGGTIYGDVVTVSKRISANEYSDVEDSEVINSLLDAASEKIASQLSDKLDAIRNVKFNSIPPAEFTLKTNVDSVSVELDGAIIGSISTLSSTFSATPGLHRLRLTKKYYSPWERTVNIYNNQVLNISMEMSNAGITHMRDRLDAELTAKEREAAIAITREQSAANARVKDRISEGSKTMLENSHIKLEGDIDVHTHDNED